MVEQIKTAVIIGMGLMGGSFACALRAARLCQEILGIDIDEHKIVALQEKGCIDQGLPHPPSSDAKLGRWSGPTSLRTALDGRPIASSPEQLAFSAIIGKADLIILATPVQHIIQTLAEIGLLVKPGAMIMDIGSSKGEIVAAMERLPEHVQAIGGHPMSGPLTTGLAGPDAEMFRDQVFVLTPTQRTSPTTLIFAQQLICQIGARPMIMDAAYHDQLVATMSHLPRLLPLALLDTAQAMNDEAAWTLAAGGFRESTNKAIDNIPMWLDIILTNRQGIATAIRSLQNHLTQLAEHIENSDERTLKNLLEKAANEWQNHFNR